MSGTGDESVLPIEFNDSLDPSLLPNVTLGNHSIMQAQADTGGHSPRPGMSPSGRLSPGKGRTMKEYDQQISLLKKENFSLKMRIFYMEDRMQQQYGGSQDVFKTNIELRVQVETLKKDLAEKQIVIQRASQAMEMLTSNKQQAEDSIRQKCDTEYQDLLESLKTQIEEREKECEKSSQEAHLAKGKVKDLEDQLKAANQANKDWNQKFESAEFDVQSLTGQLRLSQQAVKDMEFEKNGAVDRAKSLEKQLEEFNQRLARKDRDIQNLSAAIDQPYSAANPLDVLHLQDQCQDQKEEIAEHLKKIANLQDVLTEKENDIQGLKEKLNQMTSDLKDSNGKLGQFGKDLDEKDRLLEKYKRSVEGLIRRLGDKDKQCTSLTEKCVMWKEQCSDQEHKVKSLETEKEQVVRLSLFESAELHRTKQRDVCELQDLKDQLENAIKCLGRKEGELSRFREQLKTAMEALIQSEHAVEALQAQLKAERAEYDNKLRQQALQFQLSLSFTQDTDEEVASLKKKVKDLQNLIADQNVVNLALGRERAECEKSVAQLNMRNEDMEALKKEHSEDVQKLEREIQALKLDLNGKEMMIESIQQHPLVVETSRRETMMSRHQSDVPNRPNVLDIETIWLDLLEDMKMTLNMLRVEVQSHMSLDGHLQPLAKGDGATADLLVCEIQSIQRVYHQLEKGVEKNSQLHEALLHALRGTRQSSAESPDSSSCQDGGPSTLLTTDGERDHVDSLALRQYANSSPPSACPFPSRSDQVNRSSQTPPRVDTEDLVKHYLQTSKIGDSPDKYFDRSSSQIPTTTTSIPTKGGISVDQSPQVYGADVGNNQTGCSTPNSTLGLQKSHRSLPPSPGVAGEQLASSSTEGHSKQLSTNSPFSRSEHSLSHLTNNISSNRSVNKPKSLSLDDRELSTPLKSLSECAHPSELVCDARGRRVTFELGSDLGLTDDAKEGHLKQTYCPSSNRLESFTEGVEPDFDDSSASLMDVTHVGPFQFVREEDRRQTGQLNASATSKGDNSLTDSTSVNDSTLKNTTLLGEGGFGDNEEGEENGSVDNLRGCWADELERYQVTRDQEARASERAARSSLSAGQQQQLQHQHQQVIASMSAQELRDLIAQLQLDLIDAVRQNHTLKDHVTSLKETSSVNEDQLKQVEDKLHATENTVRYQSIRIKSYKAALDKAGHTGGSTLVGPLSDRSTMSVERVRSSEAFNGSLPLLGQDSGPMLEASVTDIQSRDGSPSQSLVNGTTTLSARSRRESSSVPSGLCFAGMSISQASVDDVASPGRPVVMNSPKTTGNGSNGKECSTEGQASFDIIDGMNPYGLLTSPAEDASLYVLDPTYTSLIDTTLFNRRLSSLDKTNSAANTTMSVDKLQARIAQLEQMNAALKEEIRLVNDLCCSQGVELGGADSNAYGKGPYANVSSRDELLRKHLIEIRQLRQRLERLDLGNDPEQHLIFQTHIHQRIRHQESLIVQLQKQMEEKEEKWQREMMETQHRLQREKCTELEKADKIAKSELEAQTSRLKEQEVLLTQFQEKCAILEQREMEANRLRDEKRETEQDLVKRELEILDMEKVLFSLELTKEGLEKRVKQLETEGEEKEAEIQMLQDQVRDHKESCRTMRDALLKRDESLREKDFTVQKMSQERSKLDQKVKGQEFELTSATQREEELKEELKSCKDRKRELELHLVDAEDSCKRKQESIYQANRQMGSLRDQAEAAEKSLRSCQEDLRSCQEDLRSCQDNLRTSQESGRSCRENLRGRDQKLQKRDKQLQHLINQYKKLDVAYTKVQYKLEEKSLAVTSLRRVNNLYEAAYKQDASEDLTQSLLQELMETKKQVADLLARLEDKSSSQYPTVCVKTYGSTVQTTDTTTKTTVTASDGNDTSKENVEQADDTPSELMASLHTQYAVPFSDIDQALDQLSASMHERFDRDGNLNEMPPTSDNRTSRDPVLKEQNENLRKELTRLQCKYDLLDHKVKEQDSRLQASSVRKKDWEKSLCRQLIKTTRELGQAKENIECTTKVLQPSSQPEPRNLDK